MGSGYIPPSLTVTAEEIADESNAYYASVIPEWEPAFGEPDTMLIEASARPAAETREGVLVGAQQGFLAFGSLVDVPRGQEAHATAQSTWTFTDTVGHTIRDGTQVVIGPADAQVAFAVDGDVVVAPGSNTTAAGAVLLTAVYAGSAANNLSGPVQLVEHPSYIDTVTLVGVSSSGADLEDEDVYRNRLSDELQLLSPSPIMAEDFAVIARRVPEVARAVAIDNYNPLDGTTNNALHVAVCPINSAGEAITLASKDALADLYDGLILQNYVVHIFDPTVTTVDVLTSYKVVAGYDTAAVNIAVEAAVNAYLNRATWGRLPGGEQSAWVDELVVREYELAEIVNRVDGVWYITSLQLRRLIGAATLVASTNVVTTPVHHLSVNDAVVFTDKTAGAGVTAGTTYYVKTIPSATTMTLAATVGGATLDITSDGTATAHTAYAAADVAITGPAALATAGTVTGTPSA